MTAPYPFSDGVPTWLELTPLPTLDAIPVWVNDTPHNEDVTIVIDPREMSSLAQASIGLEVSHRAHPHTVRRRRARATSGRTA